MLKPLRNHYDYFEHRLSEHEAGEAEALGDSEKTNAYYDQLNQASQFPNALLMQNKISLVDSNGQFADLDASAKSLTSKMASIMDNTVAASIVQKLTGSKDETGQANIYLLNNTWPIVQQKIRKLIVPGNPVSAQSMYRILISYLVNTFGKDYPIYAKDQWINDDTADLKDIAVAPDSNATEVPAEVPPEMPTEVPAEIPAEVPPEMPIEVTPAKKQHYNVVSPEVQKLARESLHDADLAEFMEYEKRLNVIYEDAMTLGKTRRQLDTRLDTYIRHVIANASPQVSDFVNKVGNHLFTHNHTGNKLNFEGFGLRSKRRRSSTQVQILEGEIRAGNDNPSIRSVLHKLVRRR